MKYCADTWFLLAFFGKDENAINLFQEIKFGKSNLIIPISVYAETFKKLLQKGFSQIDIDEFFLNVESSDKIKFLLIDRNIAKEAAKISLSNDIHMLDSFVAASYKVSSCDYLLASDSDYDSLIKKNYLRLKSW